VYGSAWWQAAPRGLIAIRRGERHRTCDGAARDRAGLAEVTVVGPGWRGTLRSPETRVDGLVSVHALSSDTLRSGGNADLAELKACLETTRDNALRLRIVLATILIALALAPRRAITAPPPWSAARSSSPRSDRPA
jgi:hypothetical protein